jgi:hypothetical protein
LLDVDPLLLQPQLLVEMLLPLAGMGTDNPEHIASIKAGLLILVYPTLKSEFGEKRDQ